MALEHVQQVTIDFQIPTSIPTPRFVQYDTNVIEFVVKDGGVDADLTDIQRIVVSLRRKDGVLLQQLLEAEGNVIRYELTDEEMNIPGYADVMLQLYDGVDHITYQTELKLYFEKTIGNEFANGRGLPLLEQLFIEVSNTGKYALDTADMVVQKVNEKVTELDQFETDVQQQITTKADKEYVDTELAKKANATTVQGLSQTVNAKADAEYVETELAKKADKTALETKADVTALETKADKEEVTTLSTQLAEKASQADITAAVEPKADKAYVDTELGKKVNKGAIAVTDIDKNKGLLDQTYMSEELLQQIAGTAPVNAVPPAKSIVTPMLNRGTVTRETTSFLNTGKNLFNKETITGGHYVNPSNGTLVASANYYTSDFIPIQEGQTYTVSVGRFMAFYNADYTYLEGITTSTTIPYTFTAPAGANYFKFSSDYTAKSADKFQVERGASETEYESFRLEVNKLKLTGESEEEFKTKLQKEIVLGPEQITGYKAGKNLFDPAKVEWGLLYSATGAVLKQSAYESYNTSGFIPVNGSTPYVSSRARVVVYYDAEQKYISGVNHSSYAPNYSFTTPATARYVRVSYQKADENIMQVEQGTEATAYEPFGYVLEGMIASKAESASENTDILLPAEVYGVVGKEMNIYFENLIRGDYKDYLFDVVCPIGQQQVERWTATPTTAGTYSLTVNMYDKKTRVQLATKMASVIIKSATAGTGTTSAIIIGDSTTNAGVYPSELKNLFEVDPSMDIELYGTQGTAPGEHEGRSGWRIDHYYNSASVADVANAFYNPATSKFDFAYYMQQTGFSAPEYVTWHLGINDVFSLTSDESVIDKTKTMFSQLDEMIANIRSYDANIKVGILLPIPPSYSQDSFGDSYDSGQTRWRYKQNWHLMVREYIKHYSGRKGENIYVVPFHLNLDTENNMVTETVPVNSRNTKTIERQSNGVHPAAEGYYQMADSLYYWMKSFGA